VSGVLTLIGEVLTILLVALLLSLLLAPFDSLSWWAGWVRQGAPAPGADPGADVTGGPDAPPAPDAPDSGVATGGPGPYVVFLSGVGTMGRQIDAWEQRLTDRLAARMRERGGGPGGVMVTGLFPFSASAQPLAERRRTGAFWARLGRMREERPTLLARLVDWRNLTQVFVSMDPRYGPIYNAGGARSLYAALVNHGYVPGSGAPVVLIGYSGGAQVCLGAATYLKPALGAPLTVISLGGAVGSDRGLEAVDGMVHLYGTGDVEQKLPALFLPSRWPLARGSRWNRALAEGRLRYVLLGDMVHTGPGGYLDPERQAPDGRSLLDVTAGAMLEIIARSTGGRPRAPAAGPR
jgi:hypothetical protein